MSLLINCRSLSKSYGSQKLFQGLSLSVFEGDRIGLIGPNGVGKSTLIKILAEHEEADEGIISPRKDLRIGYVPQSSEFTSDSPVNICLKSIHTLTYLGEDEKLNRVQTWLSKLGFSGEEKDASLLSGGWKKRLSIALSMLNEPHLLILDEPTNHLDLASIVWLEKFMQREVTTYLVVSHDRAFLESATNRTVEINPIYPTQTLEIKGSYQFFLEKKEQFILGQIEKEKSIATKVRRETDWLRSSPKARTTKANSRISQAETIFEEHAQLKRSNRVKTAAIEFDSSERQTRKLLVGKNLSKAMGENTLFKNLDISLTSGLRLALMGRNGSGKTTLMRLFADELEPDEGTIKRADDLNVVYFDQMRGALPDKMTLKEALCPAGEFVNFRGRSIHVNGWCERFLFPKEYLKMEIGCLSGGERARISIAHLMLQPADILLLDEPTNDIDIPTLETLEENLKQFPGAVVLISHDRSLLENVCTQFLSLGDSGAGTLFAEYNQWEESQKVKEQPLKKKEKKTHLVSRDDRKEKNRLEKAIEKKEAALAQLELSLEGKELEELQKICSQIEVLKQEIETLFDQWAE